MPQPVFWGPKISASNEQFEQYRSNLTVLKNGTFVGVWVEHDGADSDVWGQLFNADGSKKGDPFKINSDDAATQIDPVVTALKGGGFAVAFSSFNGTNMDVRARVYDNNGSAPARDFGVGIGAGDQTKPSIAAYGDGFVVSHLGYDATTGISNAVYDANGGAQGRTGVEGGTYQSPSVAVPDAGVFQGLFVTATLEATNAILMRTYTATTVSNEWRIPVDLVFIRSSPSVTALADGKVLLTYAASDPFGTDQVKAIIYDIFGQAGTEMTLMSGQRYGKVVVAALTDGGFAIAVEQTASQNVVARAFNGNGAPNGDAFSVHPDQMAGRQDNPSITALSDGRFVVGWSDDGGGNGAPPGHVKAQIFDPRAAGIEWTGNAGDEQFGGSAGEDFLHGGAGNDTLYGSDGSDALSGGEGADHLDGGENFDFANYGLADGGVTVNLLDLSKNDGDAKGDSYWSIEGFLGSAHADTFIGDDDGNEIRAQAGNDTLTGGTANDYLDGGEDNDDLYGGAGIDTLVGGSGNDWLDGGARDDDMKGGTGDDTYVIDTIDKISEEAGEGLDTVITYFSYTLGANMENLLVVGRNTAKLTGNALANTLTGTENANTLDGAAGNDVLVGLGGDDSYHVSDADQVIEAAGGGTDTVYVAANYTLTAEVENLVATGVSLVLNGNASNNAIRGSDGADRLDGLGGADVMSGGNGDDIYFVNQAGDQIVETASGGANDSIYSAVSFALPAHAEKLFGLGTAHIDLTGSQFADAITGNAGNNKIKGGLGKDTLVGDKGKDTFIFDTRLNKTTNLDKIVDFNVKDDTIWLDNKYLTKLGKGTPTKPVKLDKKAFWIGARAHDADDRVIYDNKKGILYYDADGSGRGKAVEIATVSKKLKMTAADFFVV